MYEVSFFIFLFFSFFVCVKNTLMMYRSQNLMYQILYRVKRDYSSYKPYFGFQFVVCESSLIPCVTEICLCHHLFKKELLFFIYLNASLFSCYVQTFTLTFKQIDLISYYE